MTVPVNTALNNGAVDYRLATPPAEFLIELDYSCRACELCAERWRDGYSAGQSTSGVPY